MWITAVVPCRIVRSIDQCYRTTVQLVSCCPERLWGESWAWDELSAFRTELWPPKRPDHSPCSASFGSERAIGPSGTAILSTGSARLRIVSAIVHVGPA
jgi:hypothetical protein